jgi:hypothetical protein
MYAAALYRPFNITGSRPGQRRGRGTEVALETVADGLPRTLDPVPEAETAFPRR